MYLLSGKEQFRASSSATFLLYPVITVGASLIQLAILLEQTILLQYSIAELNPTALSVVTVIGRSSLHQQAIKYVMILPYHVKNP